MSVSFRLVSIYSLKKGRDLGAAPASQSEHLSYAEKFFGIQRYSSLASSEAKNPRRRISDRNFENPPLRLPGSGLFPVQYYNRFGAKKIHRCGLERTSEPGWKMKMYIAAERIIRINKRMIKSIFIGFATQSNRRFDKEAEKSRIKKINIFESVVENKV